MPTKCLPIKLSSKFIEDFKKIIEFVVLLKKIETNIAKIYEGHKFFNYCFCFSHYFCEL